MGRDSAYDDWNHLYENTWPTPSFTYSKKWEWHYRDTPYIKYVSAQYPVEQERKAYKRSYPHNCSEMYKKYYGGYINHSGYVTTLGDL